MYRDLQAVSQLQLDRAICSYKLQLHRQQTNFVQNITPNSPDIIFFLYELHLHVFIVL